MTREAMTPDEHEDARTLLLPEVSTLLTQMRLDGVHDAWASYQMLVLWSAWGFDVPGLRDRLLAARRPDAGPVEYLAHLRRCRQEGLPYERAMVALWVDLEQQGVTGDRIAGMLLEAGETVLAVKIEREAFAGAGDGA